MGRDPGDGVAVTPAEPDPLHVWPHRKMRGIRFKFAAGFTLPELFKKCQAWVVASRSAPTVD